MRAALPDGMEAVTGDEAADEAASDLLEAISFITTFLLIFAGISLVVGAFLIVNTFSILVAQRSRELALLRALGASQRQVTRSVLVEAFVLGVLGSTIGLGLGVLLAMLLRLLFGQFGLDLSGRPLIFTTAHRAGGVRRRGGRHHGGGVPPGVAHVADRAGAGDAGRRGPPRDLAAPSAARRGRDDRRGRRAARARPVHRRPAPGWFVGGGILLDAARDRGGQPGHRPAVPGARPLGVRRLFGTVGNLAGQNTLRNPRRTAATASALMIGLALACTMAIVGDSAKASVDKSVADNFVGDYVVSNVFGGEFNPAIADRMAEVDGVETIVRERYQIVQIGGETQGVAATDPATLDRLELDVTAGSADDFADSTVLIQQSYADDEGLAVGDEIEVTTPTGTQTWPVVGIYEDNPVIFFPVLTTLPTLADAGFEEADNALIVFAEPGGLAGLQEGLDEVVAEIPIVTVKDQGAFADEQREPIDQFVLIIFALLGLALVIAVLGIVNTLALSVIERTREVGLLRAIGLSRAQLRRMITLESVVISVLGALLGLAMGLVFGIALMYSLRDEGLEVISVPGLQPWCSWLCPS